MKKQGASCYFRTHTRTVCTQLHLPHSFRVSVWSKCQWAAACGLSNLPDLSRLTHFAELQHRRLQFNSTGTVLGFVLGFFGGGGLKNTTKLSPVIHPVFSAQFSGGTCNVPSTWRKKSQETLDYNIHPLTTKQTRVQVKTSFIELFILFVLLINCFCHCRHTLQSCCCCFLLLKVPVSRLLTQGQTAPQVQWSTSRWKKQHNRKLPLQAQ